MAAVRIPFTTGLIGGDYRRVAIPLVPALWAGRSGDWARWRRRERDRMWGSTLAPEPRNVVSYISRVVELPPGTATTEVTRLAPVVQVRTGLLELTGSLWVPPPGVHDVLLARAPAVVRPGAGGPVTVELELCRWSAMRTEVGLRVRGRTRPSRHYFATAHLLLERLKHELERPRLT